MTASEAQGQSLPLTRRQKQVLAFIRESNLRRGYSPSYQEIADAVGLASVSSVSYHVKDLEKKERLRRVPGQPRTLEVVPRGDEAEIGDAEFDEPEPPPADAPDRGPADHAWVPLVGEIKAGLPIIPQQVVEDTFLLPRRVVGYGTLFMLRVDGDSMDFAGIRNGDFVVVREQNEVQSGDIVAALVHEPEPGATIKTYQRAGDGQIWLMPHNPGYAPIPGAGATIMGKVVAVLRGL